MAKKNSYERQDQIQAELLSIAKRGFQTKTLVQTLIEEGAKRPKRKVDANKPTFSGKWGATMTDEQMAEYQAKKAQEEANKEIAKKIKRANAKAKRAQAKQAAADAKEAAFKAMIARKAQEQIAARKA